MKYIKTYESANKYKIGDYVVCVADLADHRGVVIPHKEKFLQIVEISDDHNYYRCKLLSYPDKLLYGLSDQSIRRKADEYEITAMNYNL